MTACQQWWGIVRNGDIPVGAFFLEDFEAGIGAYTTLSGNPALWSITASPYGSQCLRMAAASGGGVNRIGRAVPLIQFNRMQVKFRVTAIGSDDSGLVSIWNGATLLLGFDPVREAYYDATRAPWIKVDPSDTFSALGTTVITTNVWYRLTVKWLGGSSGVQIIITNANTGAVFCDITRAGTFALPTVDSLQLNDDNTVGSCATEWDDIYLYSE